MDGSEEREKKVGREGLKNGVVKMKPEGARQMNGEEEGGREGRRHTQKRGQ